MEYILNMNWFVKFQKIKNHNIKIKNLFILDTCQKDSFFKISRIFFFNIEFIKIEIKFRNQFLVFTFVFSFDENFLIWVFFVFF